MTASPPETRASSILRLQDAADIVAWNEFAEIYAPVVYRSARRLGLQAADADDVVQEVLSAVARSVKDWIERDDRGAFLCRPSIAKRRKRIRHLEPTLTIWIICRCQALVCGNLVQRNQID